MTTTTTDLFRSIMGNDFKKIKDGVYPGDGVLDPRWVDTQRFVRKTGKWKTDFADVSIVAGADGPEVQTGGGTSLHDVSGWFLGREFSIPEGTEYSDEIYIRKHAKRKTSEATKIEGYRYQLEPRVGLNADDGCRSTSAVRRTARSCPSFRPRVEHLARTRRGRGVSRCRRQSRDRHGSCCQCCEPLPVRSSWADCISRGAPWRREVRGYKRLLRVVLGSSS